MDANWILVFWAKSREMEFHHHNQFTAAEYLQETKGGLLSSDEKH